MKLGPQVQNGSRNPCPIIGYWVEETVGETITIEETPSGDQS